MIELREKSAPSAFSFHATMQSCGILPLPTASLVVLPAKTAIRGHYHYFEVPCAIRSSSKNCFISCLKGGMFFPVATKDSNWMAFSNRNLTLLQFWVPDTLNEGVGGVDYF